MRKKDEDYRRPRNKLQRHVQWTLTLGVPLLFALFGDVPLAEPADARKTSTRSERFSGVARGSRGPGHGMGQHMHTDKKLIFALIVLAALGGAVILQQKNQTPTQPPTASRARRPTCPS